MEPAEALASLMEDSSQVRRAVVLDDAGDVVASAPPEQDGEALARVARDVLAAAAELHASQDVTRVEVELVEGAVFVLREAARTIAATTGSSPTAGLVVYDLRTCLHRIDEEPSASAEQVT